MAFVYVFPIVVNDAVVGLGLRFCCDFGGWGLRLWVVVTVAVVVVAMAVVEWVFFFFFFFLRWCWLLVASSGCEDVGFAGLRRNRWVWWLVCRGLRQREDEREK